MWAMIEKLRMDCGSGIRSHLPLVTAVEANPLREQEVCEHNRNDHDGRNDSGVQMKDEHRRHTEGDEQQVDAPDTRAAAAEVLRSAVRAGHRAASPRSFSTMTVSRHAPSSFPWRS